MGAILKFKTMENLIFSRQTALVQYFMLCEQVVYLCLSIGFQGSSLQTFDQDRYLIFLFFLCSGDIFSLKLLFY